MIALTYVSQATDRFNQNQLIELLNCCHQNNQHNNITGLLLYNGLGTFIQALEGDEALVTSLFEKIRKDPRHRRVNQIGKKKISTRSFPNWKMGFRFLKDISIDSLPGFSDFMQQEESADYLTNHQSFAHDLLYYFKNQTNELVFE